MKINIDEIRRDPEVLLEQVARYVTKVIEQLPEGDRKAWSERLVQNVLEAA